MYLYWMAVLAGSVTVTANATLVSVTGIKGGHRGGKGRTAPGGVVGRGEEERVVGGPVLERVDAAGDVDVLCGRPVSAVHVH